MKQQWQDILLARMLNSMRINGGVAVATVLAATQASATIAYNFPEAGLAHQPNSVSSGPWTTGYEFETNPVIKVTTIGALPGETGFSPAGTVPLAVYGLAETEPMPDYSSLGPGSPTPGEGMWGTPTPTPAGDIFELTPVPEVAAFAVAGLGLLGLVYIVRYARLRRKMKPA